MDSYGKRLLLVAAMIGTAALCAAVPISGLIPGAKPRQEEPQAAEQTTEQTEETATETETRGALPLSAGVVDERGFAVVLRTTPGRELRLLDRNGAHLQTVRANERGDATFQGVLPGQYRINAGRAHGEFYLWENAAVSAVSGMLWSDGELLHLTDVPTVDLRLNFYTLAPQTGRVVTVTLTAKDGTRFDRSLVAGQPGRCTVEFHCLPPGDYRVRVDGQIIRVITLDETAEQEVSLWE